MENWGHRNTVLYRDRGVSDALKTEWNMSYALPAGHLQLCAQAWVLNIIQAHRCALGRRYSGELGSEDRLSKGVGGPCCLPSFFDSLVTSLQLVTVACVTGASAQAQKHIKIADASDSCRLNISSMPVG